MQRHLSWAAALRDLKADRAERPVIREERLRCNSGLRGTPALALSAWRGNSGRRYVVGVHSFSTQDVADAIPAVLIAVRRDAAGLASVVDAIADRVIGRFETWAAACQKTGATELHIHRLAGDEADRAAIVADLTAVEEVAA